MLAKYSSFEHYTILGSTESAVLSGPNRSSEQSADDCQYFFGQMDTEYDVDHVQTVLNVVRFPDPPNRPSNRYGIDDQINSQAGDLI